MTVAVGFFDGVHLGHRKILSGAHMALTFSRHPLSVLAPEKAPQLITSLEDKIAAIRSCGVEEVRALDFTPSLAAMPPQEFAAKFLCGDERTAKPVVRCGANWRFGRDGKGDAAFLRSLGYTVEVVDYAEYENSAISSTRIRRALESGEIEKANTMLGRPFAVDGKLAHGKGVGGKIGYPTLNFILRENLPRLPFGVYACTFRGVRAVANYGLAPTMGDLAWQSPVLEVHLLEEIDESMNREIDQFLLSWACCPDDRAQKVALLSFLRPERKFASTEELVAQIARDVERAKSFK